MANAMEIASLFARVGADTDSFDKAMKSVKSDMSALDKTTAALGASFKAAFAVGAAAVAGFSAVIAKSVGAASDMEQGVADVGAMMALTDKETTQLGDHIMDLGLDPKLKVSATEASAAIMSLGTAGASVSDIMGGMSKATVLLANATGLKGEGGLANAATIASDVMAQFNITAANMDKAVNQIAGTTVASKFSVDDYRLAIAQAGGVAAGVGVSFEDFNAVIAATSSRFASGSDAGTSFGTFLSRLVPTTEPAKIALKELGLMAEDGGSKFFDAAGNMKSAEEIAGLLQKAFTGLSDAQRIETATTLFGTDARRTALALADGGTAIITKMKDAIGKVDAEELAAKRMNTFQGSMEIALGIIETLSISIGNKFLPVLRPLVDRFSELAQIYGPMVVDFFGAIADRLADFIGGFTKVAEVAQSGNDAFREAANVAGQLTESLTGGKNVAEAAVGAYDSLREKIFQVVEIVQTALRPITDAIAKFVTWNDVLTALGLIMGKVVIGAIGALIVALWPIISTIALITAAVAALRWAWQNDFAGIKTYTMNTLETITKWFQTESGLWHGSWEKTMQHFVKWMRYGWNTDIVQPFLGYLLLMKSGIYAWANGSYQRFLTWFNETKQKFTTGWNEFAHIILSWAQDTKSDIAHWVSVTLDKFQNWVDVLETKFMVWKNNMRALAEDWRDAMLSKMQPFFDWWNDKVRPMIEIGKRIVDGLWIGMQEAWRGFMQWWNSVWGKDLTKTVQVKMETHSPSKVMERLGKYAVEGFAIGADKAMPMVYDAMGGLANASIGAGEYVFGGSSGDNEDTALMRENNSLLKVLIAELRAKNMNVTVNSGGGQSITAFNTIESGLR